MRVEHRDGTQERRILTGMIVDTAVLGLIAAQWPEDGDGLFRSRYANTVAGWCIAHHLKYSKAPGPAIEGIAEAWAAKGRDKDTITLVNKFLSGLSEDYTAAKEAYSSEYISDLAGEYFNNVKLQQLAESIQDDFAAGRHKEAHERQAAFNRVELGVGAGIDVLQDLAAIRDAFEDQLDPIVAYPGALGKFINDAFERDAFISFLGTTGSGKTWMLIDLAWRAMEQRRRVAFFEVGDLSQRQIMRRFMIRCARQPRRAGRIWIPKGLTPGEQYTCEVDRHPRDYDKPLSWQRAAKAAERVMRTRVRSRHSYLKCSTHSAGSINVNGIADILQGWERQGWVADVILIDYADELAPQPGYLKEKRDQITATWTALRGLSERTHTLVATATQADAKSYTATTMRRVNFSDDRRKLDKVTAMFGISQTEAEKQEGLWRLNILKVRDIEYNELRCCHVAGCLAIGNPVMRSCLWTPPEE